MTDPQIWPPASGPGSGDATAANQTDIIAKVGAVGDTATAENLSDVATTSLHAKVRRALLGIGHATYGLSAIKTLIDSCAKTAELISGAAVTFGAAAVAQLLAQAQLGAAAALAAVAYTRQAGVMQVKATTFELNQAAASYDLATGTTQDVEIASVTVRNLTNMTGGGCTSFSVQTNDTTAQTFISNTSAVKASLAVGAQFSWVGSCILKATKKIQITINGAASGGTDVMDVVITYRAITTGGYLA